MRTDSGAERPGASPRASDPRFGRKAECDGQPCDFFAFLSADTFSDVTISTFLQGTRRTRRRSIFFLRIVPATYNVVNTVNDASVRTGDVDIQLCGAIEQNAGTVETLEQDTRRPQWAHGAPGARVSALEEALSLPQENQRRLSSLSR